MATPQSADGFSLTRDADIVTICMPYDVAGMSSAQLLCLFDSALLPPRACTSCRPYGNYLRYGTAHCWRNTPNNPPFPAAELEEKEQELQAIARQGNCTFLLHQGVETLVDGAGNTNYVCKTLVTSNVGDVQQSTVTASNIIAEVKSWLRARPPPIPNAHEPYSEYQWHVFLDISNILHTTNTPIERLGGMIVTLEASMRQQAKAENPNYADVPTFKFAGASAGDKREQAAIQRILDAHGYKSYIECRRHGEGEQGVDRTIAAEMLALLVSAQPRHRLVFVGSADGKNPAQESSIFTAVWATCTRSDKDAVGPWKVHLWGKRINRNYRALTQHDSTLYQGGTRTLVLHDLPDFSRRPSRIRHPRPAQPPRTTPPSYLEVVSSPGAPAEPAHVYDRPHPVPAPQPVPAPRPHPRPGQRGERPKRYLMCSLSRKLALDPVRLGRPAPTPDVPRPNIVRVSLEVLQQAAEAAQSAGRTELSICGVRVRVADVLGGQRYHLSDADREVAVEWLQQHPQYPRYRVVGQ